MSEKSLDHLIAALKSDAIEVAEKEAEKILTDAREQAEKIVGGAEKKREQLLAEARQEAATMLSKGENALRQAARDLSISVRNELLKMFQSVLEAETRTAFTPDLLKTAILKVIENIGSEAELKLSPEFSKALANYLHDRLKSSEKTVSIVEDNSILNGFSISNKNQGWSYDITPEEVAAALRKHLTGNWVDILKNETKP